MSHKMFDNNSVSIRKSKLASKLNKPAYTRMSILELSKVLMYEFHCDYIKNNFDNKSKLLFTDTDSLMQEFKTEDFSSDKEIFDFRNYSTKSKYYDNSNKLVMDKMKDKTTGVAVKQFFELKPKMQSFLVDTKEHEKSKDVNRTVVATISHNERKDV